MKNKAKKEDSPMNKKRKIKIKKNKKGKNESFCSFFGELSKLKGVTVKYV